MQPIDLVIEARWLAARIEKDGSELRPISTLLGRLADEIERLRSELDAWKAARDWSGTP